VALLSGGLGGDSRNLLETFDYAVSIACGQVGLDAMIKGSRRDLGFAAANLMRAITLGEKRRA
jgi:glycerate kinase